MKRRDFKYLCTRRISIPGVKAPFERLTGKRDVKNNQLCEYNGWHITPIIDTKVKSYDSHINDVLLRTARELEPMIREANIMAVELNLLLSGSEIKTGSDINEEEKKRQAAYATSKKKQIKERKEQILKDLASIKAESDTIDEMLLYYEQRAAGLLQRRVAMYWRGVLAGSSEKLEHCPCLDHKESVGRRKYDENRMLLLDIVNKALRDGGGVYYEEKDKKEENC